MIKRTERAVPTAAGHTINVIETSGAATTLDPPLVLVHGFTGSTDDWDEVSPALAASRRVIAFDHRGHGDSTNYGEPSAYSLDLLVADMVVVLDALDVGECDLIGHSMGGAVAMRYVIAHADEVRSLVLMDTSAEPLGIPAAVIEHLSSVARTDGMAVLFERFNAFSGGADVDPGKLERFIRMDPEAFAALGAELISYPSLVAPLRAVTCATTVIVGANDLGLRTAADTLAATVPGAELVVIADAGHSPQQDQPAAWIAAVHYHLSRGD